MQVVRFRPEVADDLRDATAWYEAKRSGLGDEFLREYWSAVERLAKQPFAYAVTEVGLRACRLARFPYVIHYRSSETKCWWTRYTCMARSELGRVDRRPHDSAKRERRRKHLLVCAMRESSQVTVEMDKRPAFF